MSYYQDCSSSSTTNNNKTRGRSWNHPTASGNPLGMEFNEVGGDRSQSGISHGMSQSESELSSNNPTSVGNPLGMNLLNGLIMPGNPTSTKQTKTDNEMWQSNTNCTSYDQTYSYSSATNNNTSQGRSWNLRTTSGTPLGMELVEVCENRVQSGTPHGIRQSESEPSGNNFTSAGNPSGMNLSNGLPMPGNPTSKKDLE